MSDTPTESPNQGPLFELEVRLEKPQDSSSAPLRAGYPVMVVINLTNRDTASTTISRFSNWFEYEYHFVGPDDKEVIRSRFGREKWSEPASSEMGSVTLDPGQSMVSEILLNRIFDMTRAGTYKLSVSREVRSATTGDWVALRSNELVIQQID